MPNRLVDALYREAIKLDKPMHELTQEEIARVTRKFNKANPPEVEAAPEPGIEPEIEPEAESKPEPVSEV